MEINYLLVIFAVLVLFSALRGARKGMIRIVFALISWIFLIVFVNFASVFVSDYIKTHTSVPSAVQEHIDKSLHARYKISEEKEAGTGQEAVLSLVPQKIEDEIRDTISTSIDDVIMFVAKELTDTAIDGLSTIISLVIGIIIIGIIDRLLRAVGFVPGIKDINKTLGFIAGMLQGVVITWFCMYLAKCFSYTALGSFIVENNKTSKILSYLYENNLIERIIRI